MAVQNIVELLFRVSDQATGPSRNIAASFDGLKGAATAAAAATAAVGAGVLAVAKQAVDLGSKFEDTAINIAGNIRAFELAPTFDAATKSAADALATIEAMAAKLPGETDQYVEVFKVALPKAIESGMSDIKAITDLTSRFTAVAVSGGVEAGQAGMDLFRMIAGQAGADVRMFTMLAPHLKMTAAQFNKLTIEARRLAIDKSLGNFKEMMEAAGNTFSSKMGEAQSHLKTLVRLAGQPIFTAAVDALSKMNEYFSENEKSLMSMGKALSGTLIAGVKTLVDNFESLLKLGKNIVEVFIAFKAGVIASELTTGLIAIVRAFQAIRTAAVGAAAAEAFATGGASALVGAAAAASVYAAFKMTESDISSEFKERQTLATLGPPEALSKEQRAALERISGQVMDIATRQLGQPGLVGLNAAQQIQVLKQAAEGYAVASVPYREMFAKYVKDLGLELADVIPSAVTKAAKPTLPAGPKKADVVIENARFDIRQAFAEGYDPDRIAAAFVESIGSTALYPGQSGFAAAGTGA